MQARCQLALSVLHDLKIERENPYVVNLYAIVFASMELGEVVLLNLFDTGVMLMGFFMATPLWPMLVALVSFETFS